MSINQNCEHLSMVLVSSAGKAQTFRCQACKSDFTVGEQKNLEETWRNHFHEADLKGWTHSDCVLYANLMTTNEK